MRPAEVAREGVSRQSATVWHCAWQEEAFVVCVAVVTNVDVVLPKQRDLVLCIYRVPSPHQPWLHPIWIGVIEEPSDNPASWNGCNSERAYCELTGKLKVIFRNGTLVS